MTLDPIRRIPAARAVAHSARRALERLRPLPLPRYVPNTPNTGGSGPLEAYFPPTISTLADASLAPETAEQVLALLSKLTPCADTEGQELFYKWAHDRFGEHWRYADSTTVLMAASRMLQPKAYLEIGVRRGRSAAAVGAMAPDCAIYGFDLWLSDYGGLDNPGPDFVRGEIAAAGHHGTVTFVSGDSGVTVPKFLDEHREPLLRADQRRRRPLRRRRGARSRERVAAAEDRRRHRLRRHQLRAATRPPVGVVRERRRPLPRVGVHGSRRRHRGCGARRAVAV